ncbi:GRF zinc finger domain-containing protein [Cladophialophora carrionii]|uniref:GRF zinc finger domain-containing protein n=1 Tax=Cladophialophora carrionii TaxID=86049 RepID=A0A1C1CES1_9EURO|nr:GRF zinc finger domain-containing protein [Cladophialophora carrionii]
MDAFISRKRRCESPPPRAECHGNHTPTPAAEQEEESTDIKLAILSSLHPARSQDDLLEILLSCDGSVDAALEALSTDLEDVPPPLKRRLTTTPGTQSALPFKSGSNSPSKTAVQPLTRKGKTLHLYTPEDIANNTPCSIIHNFLPPYLANALLEELLAEVPSYESIQFRIFDNVVKSPHTACFYVDSLADIQRQRSEYYYNGNDLGDIRQLLPIMRQVSDLVRDAVNKEIDIRIRDFYPDGRKLKYQSPKPWQPNAAFVNCYDGGAQHVGYHSDQLSYLGPRAIIGSLSLGVAREFRVRKIVPKDDPVDENARTKADSSTPAADVSGQIAIHLPHNSLLVMHAEMQEEWKHSIAPAVNITPHPVAGNKRINITYRWYREEFRPKYTPKCKCGLPTVLKTVQKQKANRGRYMWMCQVGSKPGGGAGCGHFEWAQFTDDGVPVGWKAVADEDDLKKEMGVLRDPEQLVGKIE